MVVSPPPTNWIFDIFSWEHLSAVVTVFALLMSTAFIPVWQLLKKRRTEREKHQDERDTHKIKSISEEIIKPIVEKLNQQDETVKDLKISAKENDKNTRDTLSTVRALVSEIHNFKNEQYKVNTKLYYQTLNLRQSQQQQTRPAENNRAYRDWRVIENVDDDDDNINTGIHDDGDNGINP